MRIHVLVAVLGVLLVGCESKPRPPEPATDKPVAAEKVVARAPLADLTAASTLEPARKAFNAHKGEARFLTLLSPT